jgi:hypothetical protein
MGDLPRWASRFQFTRELWSDVDRLVLDPALERALASGELAAGDGPIFAELADALLPQDGGGRQTWFLAERGRRVAEYARQRSGAVFADVREGVQLAGDESWRFAQCDLTGLLEDEQAGLTTPLADRVSPAVAAVLETLSEMVEEGRALALSVPSRAALKERGVSEEVFFDYLAEYFPSARVYGLADSPAVGIYDFGPVEEEVEGGGGREDADARAPTEVYGAADELDYRQAEADYDAELDAAEQTWSGEETEPGVEPEFEADEVPIDYDNSLGELEPRYFAYLALVGSEAPPEGLTVVELSGDGEVGEVNYRGHEPEEERVAEASGLRAQLAEAQRQADLLAVERQGLLERLDDAQEKIEELEDELEDLRDDDDGESRSVSGEIETGSRVTPDELVGRLDAALAREQELRWRVTSLGAELEAALARPVEELEADLASLRAQLEARPQDSAPTAPGAPALPDSGAPVASPPASSVASGDRSRAELRFELDVLLRKVERGGFNGLELHRALRKIRNRWARG